MRVYETLSRESPEARLKDWPRLKVKKCEEEVNALFKAYLFFRDNRKENARDFWCSACGKHESIDWMPRTVSPKLRELLSAEHNQKAKCPWCGKRVTVKQWKKIGMGKNLAEYHPVVFMDEKEGELFLQAFWARKLYDKDYEKGLTEKPKFMQTAAFRFRPGQATAYYTQTYDSELLKSTLTDKYNRNHWFSEPFTNDSWSTMGLCYYGYAVFGWNALDRSDFRYCGYRELQQAKHKTLHEGEEHDSLIRFLGVATVYPRQTEMLIKTGFQSLVSDLMFQKKKNVRILNWNEPDFRKAFKMSGQELSDWRASGGDLQVLETYKTVRDKGFRWPMTQIREQMNRFGYTSTTVIDQALKRGIHPSRAFAYLEKLKGNRAPFEITQTWTDWLMMAERLGYDLQQETVLMPKNLRHRHDEAAKEIRRLQEREKREKIRAEKEAAAKRLEDWHRKYDFSLDGYFIRAADDRDEIIQEGRALEHCVGGYAERHMAGTTTILFLRREETPEASLYTIEMNGNTLKQIHGFRNERDGQQSPKKSMAWMLEPWIKWLKKGSPREKDGSPKLPKFATKTLQEVEAV